MNTNTAALILFSGGQDSTTLLGKAVKEKGPEMVAAISFDYGQRHAIELECAERICKKLGVAHLRHKLPNLGELVDSALVDEGDTAAPHPQHSDLPASFVPGRNALLLTLAHAYAQTTGAGEVWGGMCQTDYSGYPDCREEFISCMEMALNIGYQTKIKIVTPLMMLTKAQTFAMALEFGVLNLVVQESHTCYNGDHNTRHVWGFGCGKCPACQIREKGFTEFLDTGVIELEEFTHLTS